MLVKKPIIYVSGPYSHDPELCVTQAIEAAELLANKGAAPIIPHMSHFWNMIYPHPWEFWLRIDCAILRGCDALIRLVYDEIKSTGSEMEMNVALVLEIPVFWWCWQARGSNQLTPEISKWLAKEEGRRKDVIF